jgi:PAS domain S-box-containing protein
MTINPDRTGTDPGSHKNRRTDIIDSLPDATFVIDSDGIVIAWNKAMEALTGVPAKSMLGKGNYEPALPFYKERRPMLADLFFMPDDEIKKHYDTVERSGDTFAADIFIPDFPPSGAWFWAKACPLYDAQGNVSGAIESLRDISLWKRTERALRKSEEKYHELVENANSIILKWDKSGRITFFNEFAQRFFGFTSTEILGKPVVGTIVPPTESGSERDLRAMIDDIIHHPEHHIHNENENITKDGRRVWIQWHNRILLDENGQFTGLLSVGTDITEQKQAEQALRESGERYRTLFENSGNPLIVINEDYSIVQLNREYELWFGYRREDVEGRKWTEFIADPSDIERLKEYHQLRRIHTDAAPATYECRIVDRSGSIRNVIITAAMIPGTHQSLIAVVDITARKRAEDELQALLTKTSEDMRYRYLTIFENSGTGMAVVEDDGTISLANSMLEQITGVPRSEVEHRRSVFSFVVPEEREEAERYHRSLREEGKDAFRLDESRIIRKDGSIRNIVISGKVFPGTRESIISILDITERKQMEETLRQSEERFRRLISRSFDAIQIHQDGRIVLCNDAAAQAVGASGPGDVIGKPMIDFVHPDCRGIIQERVREMLQSPEEAVPLIEEKFLRLDGTPFIVEAMATATQFEGRPAIMVVFRDITERKQMEDALRESENRFRTLTETSLTGIYIIQDWMFRYVNPTFATLLGYQPEEMIGREPFSFVHPDDQEMVRERVQRRMNHKETISIYDSRFVTRDGRTIYMSILGVLVPYKGREAIFGNMLDLTERRKMEDALRSANKKITMLASITRHDIRNQLLALRGYLDLSRMKIQDPEILSFIEKGDKAAEAITEQIEFSKAYEEIGVNAPEWQNIPELIRKAQAQLPIPVTVEVRIDMPQITVFADRLIEKVFYNLMENTLRHGGNVSGIRFSFVMVSGEGAIVYEDNGVGVSLSDKPRLFEKGFGKNTGLGLFLSREILAITGITIRECGEPGKGVRFEIIVPRDGYRCS